MNLNTYPYNPFPASADKLAEIDTIKSGLTNYETQNDLNLEVPDRKNLCNNDKNGVGYYDNEGTYQNNVHYATSDLIPVEQGKTYIASLFNKTTGERVSGLVYSTWDANKNFVAQSVNDSIAISSGVSYVRIRNFQSDITYIDDDNYVYQLEQGSTATAYAPYIPSVESRLEAVESETTNTYDFSTPSGYNAGGRIILDKFGYMVILRFVDYIPTAPSGNVELFGGLPQATNGQTTQFFNIGSQTSFKVFIDTDGKLYSYYNADKTGNTDVYNGQLVYFTK